MIGMVTVANPEDDGIKKDSGWRKRPAGNA